MKILITGGAGFIGVNAALYFSKNHDVTIMDNLSREGTVANLTYLIKNRHVKIKIQDITEPITVKREYDVIIHLAAQVGVQKKLYFP